MTDEQIREAAWTVQSVSGASAYIHGVDYPLDKFKEELARVVEHIKANAHE